MHNNFGAFGSSIVQAQHALAMLPLGVKTPGQAQ